MIRLHVKEIAEQKGLSIGKLSQISKVPFMTIKHIYDNPYYGITKATLEKLARALEVTTTELAEEENDDDGD